MSRTVSTVIVLCVGASIAICLSLLDAGTTVAVGSSSPKAPVSIPNPARLMANPALPAIETDDQAPLPTVSSLQVRRPTDPWRSKLYTPTYITRILGIWFIVDCWHHRVIYSPIFDAPIGEWFDLDLVAAPSGGHAPMRIPHSVATDGDVVVVESSVGGSNGQNHSVLVYKPSTSRPGHFDFVHEVAVSDRSSARRPHRVVYDSDTAAFYVYMTSPPALSKFVREDDGSPRLRRVFAHPLPFMRGMYARSIAIHNRTMYITSGPGVIWSVDFASATGTRAPQPIKAFSTKPLGFIKGKMNDLFYHSGWWYATATVPCNIVRFRSLDALAAHERLAPQLGMCRDIRRNDERCTTGTPYFLSFVDGRVFVPYIFGCSGVLSFTVGRDTSGGHTIGDVKQHWGGGWVEKEDDRAVRGTEW